MTSTKDEKPVVGPNQDLYDRLSQPLPDREFAGTRLDIFLSKVQRLREDLGISDVLVICAVHYKPAEGEKETISSKALALGSPEITSQLGALGFQAYTLPEIQRGDKLRAIAKGQSYNVRWGDGTEKDEMEK